MKQPIPYWPKVRIAPERILDVGSAWIGIESILFSLLQEFGVRQRLAVELGVEYGYSCSALANHFGQVIGVDTFRGLDHDRDSQFVDKVRASLLDYPNVCILQMDWKEFAEKDHSEIDLIHIDLDHSYQQTYEVGEWAIHHAPVVILHDTESWKEDVGRACGDLAEKYEMFYHNYEPANGLGILSWKDKR